MKLLLRAKRFLAAFTAVQLLAALVVPAATFASPVPTTTIVGWNFNNQDTGAYGLNSSSASFFRNGDSELDYVSHSGTDKAASSANWTPNDSWEVAFDAADFQSLNVVADHRSSGTGPGEFGVFCKTDSAQEWTSLGTFELSAGNWHDGLTNFELPSACENSSLIHIKWEISSDAKAPGGGTEIKPQGTNSIDNIVVSGTSIPTEPVDVTAPVFGDYSDITIPADSVEGAVVNYELPNATDDSGAAPEVVCTPESDTQFEVGTTEVNCTATDGSGNHSDMSFNVTVEEFVPPVVDTDQDGVPDGIDNCPLVANIDQADKDLDGVGDACETEPPVVDLDVTAPDAPTNLTPVNGVHARTVNQMEINWSEVTDPSAPVNYLYQSAYDENFALVAYTSGLLTEPRIATPGTPEGTYYWHVKAKDAAGNESGWSETWMIVVDNTSPVITVNPKEVTIEVGTVYELLLGVTVSDNSEEALSIQTTTDLDVAKVGDYTIYYDVVDSAGNEAAQETRIVHVVDTTKPVIGLIGESKVTLKVGDTYIEEGAIATDNYDGVLTDNIVTTSTVDTAKAGTYTVSYSVADSSGNQADTVARIVIVEEPAVVTPTGNTENQNNNQSGSQTVKKPKAESQVVPKPKDEEEVKGAATDANNDNRDQSCFLGLCCHKFWDISYCWWLLIILAVGAYGTYRYWENNKKGKK